MSKRSELRDQLVQRELSSVWPQWSISNYIGSGSFGDVYEIFREENGNVYKSALKVIRVENPLNKTVAFSQTSKVPDNSAFPQDIEKEIGIMEQLKGAPNIIVIEDHAILYDEKDEYTILIRMELLENLHSYINRKGVLSQKEIIKLGIDICRALTYCEKRNIIHRDIKEDNLFYSPIGDFKLGDFGVSRQLEKALYTSGMTQIGTSAYIAPEIYWGDKYDASVDTYSLGIVLYKLLNNNRYPFCPDYPASMTSEDVARANMIRLQKTPIPLPSNTPKELGEIIVKACNPDRKLRYKNAYEFKKALEEYERGNHSTDSSSNCCSADTARNTNKKQGVNQYNNDIVSSQETRPLKTRLGNKKKTKSGIMTALILSSILISICIFVLLKKQGVPNNTSLKNVQEINNNDTASSKEISEELCQELYSLTESTIQKIDTVVEANNIDEYKEFDAVYAGCNEWKAAKKWIGKVDFSSDMQQEGIESTIAEKGISIDSNQNYVVSMDVTGSEGTANVRATYDQDLSDYISIETEVEYTDNLKQDSAIYVRIGGSLPMRESMSDTASTILTFEGGDRFTILSTGRNNWYYCEYDKDKTIKGFVYLGKDALNHIYVH